jgi:hypothetical protein
MNILENLNSMEIIFMSNFITLRSNSKLSKFICLKIKNGQQSVSISQLTSVHLELRLDYDLIR